MTGRPPRPLAAAALIIVGALASTPLNVRAAEAKIAEALERLVEAYLALGSSQRISFEHACYLVDALERRSELALKECPACGALMVADLLRIQARVCTFCETEPVAREPPSPPAH